MSGAWAGSYVAICPTSSTCGSAGAGPTGTQALSLILTQTGTTISGQINLTGWFSLVADVTGTIAPDGTMSLQGGSSWPASNDSCRPAGGWQLVSWNGRYDPRNDTIAGSFSFVTQTRASSCYYIQSLAVNATSLSFTRGAVSSSPFQGHWQGTLSVRDCSTVGWAACYPLVAGDVISFDLRLTQNGTSVSGTLARLSGTPPDGIPVTGSASPDGLTLTLGGSQNLPSGAAVEVVRITGWSTRRDTIGRLQGSLSFIYETAWTSAPRIGSVWSSSYDADLHSVVLVPWP